MEYLYDVLHDCVSMCENEKGESYCVKETQSFVKNIVPPSPVCIGLLKLCHKMGETGMTQPQFSK